MKENLPKGWSLSPIGELYDFIGGGTPDKKTPLYWDGEIPWASVKDIKGKYLLNTIDHNVRNRFAVVVPLAAISR